MRLLSEALGQERHGNVDNNVDCVDDAGHNDNDNNPNTRRRRRRRRRKTKKKQPDYPQPPNQRPHTREAYKPLPGEYVIVFKWGKIYREKGQHGQPKRAKKAKRVVQDTCTKASH
jgi:hypothetical protein